MAGLITRQELEASLLTDLDNADMVDGKHASDFKLATEVVPLTHGGTGASDATTARTNLGLGSVNNTADSAKNVLSATKLTTARTISGVSFDGSANITIPYTGVSGTPASLPANGGNADTVDGKHATDFLMKEQAAGDLNITYLSGFYNGTFTNHPSTLADGQGNCIVLNYGGSPGVSAWTRQIFISAHDRNLWTRNAINSVWNPWEKGWNSGNDGSGSGMDADTLDGHHASDMLRYVYEVISTQDWNNYNQNGMYHVMSSSLTNGPSGAYPYGTLHVTRTGDACTQTYTTHHNVDTAYAQIWVRTGWNGSNWNPWVKVWHSGNDGHGGGLVADTVDGWHGDRLTKVYELNSVNIDTIVGENYCVAISEAGHGTMPPWNPADGWTNIFNNYTIHFVTQIATTVTVGEPQMAFRARHVSQGSWSSWQRVTTLQNDSGYGAHLSITSTNPPFGGLWAW